MMRCLIVVALVVGWLRVAELFSRYVMWLTLRAARAVAGRRGPVAPQRRNSHAQQPGSLSSVAL